jgi:hypothetical protein
LVQSPRSVRRGSFITVNSSELVESKLGLFIPTLPLRETRQFLNSAEYTVFQKVLRESALGAVLNEKEIRKTTSVKLPESHRQRIIPDSIYANRKDPDIRIARRATTIASLACYQ